MPRHDRPAPILRPIRCLAVSLLLAAMAVLAGGNALAGEPAPFTDDDTLETVREKITQNGYHFTVSENWVTRLPKAEREAMRSRGRARQANALRTNSLETAAALPRRDSLPTAFDWRDVNGKSSIGAIRDQGSCGSCYAFAAAAAAEGAYNVAKGLTGANVADFSEQYLAFCLGAKPAYSDHFSGCDGADYSYTELYALTQDGITTEATMPYTGSAPASCVLTNPPIVKFKSWGRVGCNDIEAIKTAIMTYGPVDAAVNTTSAFDGYDSGVYQDTQTTCDAGDACYNTTTDHAIALVGWDDGDSSAANPGHWILRNSWGTGWGESGYMRIAYTSAKASCAVAYLIYEAPATPVTAPIIAPLLLQ